MLKNVGPNPLTWTKYPVKVECFTNNLQKARQKAENENYESTEEESLGRGKRKTKRQYNSSSSEANLESDSSEGETPTMSKREQTLLKIKSTAHHETNTNQSSKPILLEGQEKRYINDIAQNNQLLKNNTTNVEVYRESSQIEQLQDEIHNIRQEVITAHEDLREHYLNNTPAVQQTAIVSSNIEIFGGITNIEETPIIFEYSSFEGGIEGTKDNNNNGTSSSILNRNQKTTLDQIKDICQSTNLLVRNIDSRLQKLELRESNVPMTLSSDDPMERYIINELPIKNITT